MPRSALLLGLWSVAFAGCGSGSNSDLFGRAGGGAGTGALGGASAAGTRAVGGSGAGGAVGSGGFVNAGGFVGTGGFVSSGGFGVGGGSGVGGGFVNTGGSGAGGVPGSGGVIGLGGTTGAGGAPPAQLPSGGVISTQCAQCADSACAAEVVACTSDSGCTTTMQCLTKCVFVQCVACVGGGTAAAGSPFHTLECCTMKACAGTCPSFNAGAGTTCP